jgi:hypothetical protein
MKKFIKKCNSQPKLVCLYFQHIFQNASIIQHVQKKEGTAIPAQARPCCEGSRSLRFPDLKTIETRKGGKVVSPMHGPPLPPRKYSCYSFLLEAGSTPGP